MKGKGSDISVIKIEKLDTSLVEDMSISEQIVISGGGGIPSKGSCYILGRKGYVCGSI